MNVSETLTNATQLITSEKRQDIHAGLDLLNQLLVDGPDTPTYLMHLALAHFRLSEYEDARRNLSRLLRMQPNHMEARVLYQIVSDRAKRDGMISMVFTGGLVAAVGYALFKTMSHRPGRRFM
ncbi:Fis1 [Carpediemonas membranifera]|uniref:Fis1 n=1 Tax=Carpediemonas membranifera TaxID=201153 RepID=A0A8J6BXP4_9EUKA|nr:Fis1 [Carpediemonas membranifera]|eukprot:KAG9393696.1 Fis1 [Carpediemonas membranifera]